MVLTIRATASPPRTTMPGVITARPPAKFWRSSSFSARMRAVLLSITDLLIFRWRRVWVATDPRRSSLLRLSRRLGFVGRRVHQRNAAAVPDELRQVRVVAVLQDEGVAFPGEDDCLPPAVFEGLLGDDEMARPDLVPGPGQAKRCWQTVAVPAQCCVRLLPKDHNEVAVQRLPDIRHKPTAVGIKPSQGQCLGDLGYVFRTGFVDLEAQQVGNLGYEVRFGIDEPGAPRFLLVVEAKDDQRRAGGGRSRDGRFGDRPFRARWPDRGFRGLALSLRHVGSPESRRAPV